MRRIAVPLFLLSMLVCLLVVNSPSVVTAVSDSATQVGYLSPLEKEVVDEINLARAQPQKYLAFVEEYKKYYKGNQLFLPGSTRPITTFDGVAAVDEAISFLRTVPPAPPLEIAKGLWLAAKDHASDLSGNGIIGHKGSDGSYPNARVDRYGKWGEAIAESIVYNVDTARRMVVALIIDDGTPNRGHRKNIFDPNHRVIGVSVSAPASFGSKCVIDYVGSFKEKAAAQ